MVSAKLKWFEIDPLAKKYSPEKFAARPLYLARAFRWTLVSLGLTKATLDR